MTPEPTDEVIAETMARAEKIARRAGDQRCLPLPDDFESARAICTPQGRCTIGGTRRDVLGKSDRDSWDVWLALQRPEGTRRGALAVVA